MGFVILIATRLCIYSVLTLSLNLLCGYTGMLSLAHASFFAVGAYGVALLSLKLGLPFLAAIPLVMIMAALLGTVVGAPSLRLRGDYFAIATFGLQIIAFNVLNNWVSLTNGPMGLSRIPGPFFVTPGLAGDATFLGLALALTIMALVAALALVRSPFGRVLMVVREDELLARSLGKPVGRHKIRVFMFAAALAAVAGALYAGYIGYVDPKGFTINESILLLTMVVIGGAGSLWGSLTGAALFVLLPELIRSFGLPGAYAANVRQIIYGLLLIAIVTIRPQGIIGRFSLGRSEQ